MAYNLPPLDTTEDVEKYDALAESKEIDHNVCKHVNARMVGQELRCPCGAGWTGPRLHELLQILQKRP